VTSANCRNCAAPLTGPYCAQCGQHAHSSARSLGALLHDAWHVITHVDGRFWSTLWLLLTRPGQLTREYFAERRARFVPPVRLYLVISIVFFGLASLTSGLRSGATVADLADRKEMAADLDDIKREAHAAQREARAATVAAPGPPANAAQGAAADDTGDDDATGAFNFDIKDCDKANSSLHWLDQPLRDACRRNVGDHGRTLKHAFAANIPRMMFVFLPLVALVMLLLYWFPRRYYVEHLVFVLHNHAALFLVMVLDIPLRSAVHFAPALSRPSAIATFAVFCYAAWYVYRSMRRYYGQGRALTLAKLTLVGFAYLLFLSLTLLGTFVVSALIA
jgi:hypothetical protein